jgi:hypothetical protein
MQATGLFFAPTRHFFIFDCPSLSPLRPEGSTAENVDEHILAAALRLPLGALNHGACRHGNGANKTVRFSVVLRTVVQRLQHMLKYCTGLQLGSLIAAITSRMSE